MSATFWAEEYHKRSHQYYEDEKVEQAEERRQAAYAEEDKILKIMPSLLDELIEYTRVDFQRGGTYRAQ